MSYILVTKNYVFYLVSFPEIPLARSQNLCFCLLTPKCNVLQYVPSMSWGKHL